MLQANPNVAPTETTDYVKQILRETSDHKVPLDVDCGELFTPNNCYGWGTVELIGAVSRAQNLDLLNWMVYLEFRQKLMKLLVRLKHMQTQYTNRGKDGGNIQNYITNQNNLPDEIRIVAKYSSSWPTFKNFSRI